MSGQTERIESEYLAADESVSTMATMEGRRFVVTDRRVLNVIQGTTPDGRDYENVQTTLFTDVAIAEVDAEGRTTERNLLLVVLGIGAILLGLLLALVGLEGESTELLVLGVVLLGVGIWILLNSEQESPGGILILFKYPGDDGYTVDRYTLPETEVGTARAVVQAVGTPHAP